MEWDIDFGKTRSTFWIAPGYHGHLKKQETQIIRTKNGIRARVIKVEFNIQWNGFNVKEKQYLKAHYGANVKQKYHHFTRVILERYLYIQPWLPDVDWFTPSPGEEF